VPGEGCSERGRGRWYLWVVIVLLVEGEVGVVVENGVGWVEEGHVVAGSCGDGERRHLRHWHRRGWWLLVLGVVG
jgi:hypothetical protein